MKKMKLILCLTLISLLCFSSAAGVFAAYDSQISDVEEICDAAVSYVNEGSKEEFLPYMATKLEELFVDEASERSGKFLFLYSEDPSLSDDDNQLTKLVLVLEAVYVKGEDMELKQSDINKNVTPGYPDSTGVDDYQPDDAEAFMEIVNDGLSSINTVKEDNTPLETKKDNAMPPEKNSEKKAEDKDESSGGASVGVVIFISILVSGIVFAAGVYALRQLDAKKRETAGADVDNDDIFNLRLAVKSMQTSLQKADGNFKELDKLRIQVDEMDEKLESIAEYLRRLNRGE